MLLTAPTVKTFVFQHNIGEDEQAEKQPELGIDRKMSTLAELGESPDKNASHLLEIGGPKHHPKHSYQKESRENE